jgi:hypothetical protein
MTNPAGKREWTFAAVCVVCALGAGGYLYRIKQQFHDVQPGLVAISGITESPIIAPPVKVWSVPESHPISATALPAKVASPETAAPKPLRVFFRYTGIDNNFGKLAVVDGATSGNLQFIDGIACDVAHYSAGYGVCLTADRGMYTTYTAKIFNAKFQTLYTIPINGVPSRCRVSPDGRIVAFTYFISGHSYTSLDFSTQTLLVDTKDGHTVANLEDFAIERAGQSFKEQDFNFWGVTFTPDSRQFYCTLSSNRKHYLVKATTATRAGSVLHEGVECPSLSPDGLRIAFKKRFMTNGRLGWQLTILDLATFAEAPIAEKRSVDDQLEWLDNTHVLYSLPDNPNGASAVMNVWRAGIDGTPPGMILPKAYSPAVVR